MPAPVPAPAIAQYVRALIRWGWPFLPTLAATLLAAPDSDSLRRQIRETLFVADPLPPLALERHGEFIPEAELVAERISYATGYDLRVPAVVYHSNEPRRDRPAIVVVNGHGGDKYSWYAFYSGILFARAGAVVLTYDPIGEGERNNRRASGTRDHDTLQSPPELAQRLGGLMITDAMQAVSYLLSRSDVDPRRIAIVGYSLGSFVASLARAVDPRIRACVLAGGGTLDGVGEYWDTAKPMCSGLPYQSLSFLGDRAALIYRLHAERGPTLVFNGRDDEMMHHDPRGIDAFFHDLQQRVTALRGSSDGVFETGFEPGAGHRPWFVTKPVAQWLERQLDFPAWTASDIEKMGTTHVSEWARGNAVDMDPGYVMEQREGGTAALGAGIPGIKRATLNVYSDERWQKEKSRLTYEGWLAAARARLVGVGLPAYDIQRAPTRIRIDGKLDDAAWAAAHPVSPFHPVGPLAGELEPTEVKLLWDDDNLYLAYRCRDAHISAQVLERHGPVSRDDCVEVFLSPKPGKVKNYYTFEINAVGTMLNRCRTDWWKGPPTWDPEGVQCGTSEPQGVPKAEAASDREWVVELAVPLRNFAHDAAHTPPRAGDIWRLNLHRLGGITNVQKSAWSPLPPQVNSFHTPSAFGMVRFVDAVASR